MPRRVLAGFPLAFLMAAFAAPADAQPPSGKGGFGPPGFGGERPVVKTYDTDGDGRLNAEERKAARAGIKRDGGGGKKGFGKGGKGKGNDEPGRPGPKVKPEEAKSYPDAGLYDAGVLRTLFLDFEEPDWEAELEEFHGTDVDVAATLTVDGKKYPGVGVHFRGMSSYGMVPVGSKRSFNVAIDHADPKQRLLGAKTLNLLNLHEDNSLLSTVLYSHVARKHLPAPRANMVKVVVNGESWGVYSNVEQFNKDFVSANFGKAAKGAARWKVKGSPGGRGGLEYAGDDVASYKGRFEIKSDDDEKDWKKLVALCKVLAQTPADKLEEALAPIFDVENVLWFLALDVALVNNDGYWTRASDFNIVLGGDNKFRLVPHDMNEAWLQAGGRGGPPGMGGGPPAPGTVMPPPVIDVLGLTPAQRAELAGIQKEVDERLAKILTAAQLKQAREAPFGGRGGPGGGNVTLDPLVGLNDASKPLRSKLLAVPKFREKYLANVRQIAQEDLDWKGLGPVVAGYRALLEKEVEQDTRKLTSLEAFRRATAAEAPKDGARGPSLRQFADQRRAYLLGYQAKK